MTLARCCALLGRAPHFTTTVPAGCNPALAELRLRKHGSPEGQMRAARPHADGPPWGCLY